MKTWKSRIVVLAALLLGFAYFLSGGQSTPSKPETRVQSYDIAHVKELNTSEHPLKEGESYLYVCEVTVIHDDGAVYKALPFVAVFHNEEEFYSAIKGAFNTCRDYTVNLSREYADYQRRLLKNTVNAKGGRP